MKLGTLVYRTTNTVPCGECGAEAGESCRLPRGQNRYGRNFEEMFHLSRIDPASDPIGKVVREGNANNPFDEIEIFR